MDASGNSQRGVPNTIWVNDGQGNFTDSGQQLGNEESYAVALGNIQNGDGFIDAVVGNRGPDEIWFNDGQGNLSDSRQRLGSGLTRAVFPWPTWTAMVTWTSSLPVKRAPDLAE